MTTIEQDILASQPTAPRITPEDIDTAIIDTEIAKFVSRSGQVLRWAVLTTRNGYAVVGKPSCAVSPENDRAEIGERQAIENARNELWPLLAFELKTRVHARSLHGCSDAT